MGESSATKRQNPNGCPCKYLPLSLSSYTAAEYGNLHSLMSKNTRQQQQPFDVESPRTRATTSPLHLAAQHGHTAVVAWILQQQQPLDPRVRTNMFTAGGATPLHRASFAGAVGTLRLLLDHLKDHDDRLFLLLHADTSFGDQATALHKACAGGRYLAVHMLLEALKEQGMLDEGLAMRDAQGRTALELTHEKYTNRQQETLSVARWNQVAGGKPDWEKCIQLIENCTSDESKEIDAASTRLPTTSQGGILSLPSHLNPRRLDCNADSGSCTNGNCLTSSWENAFRNALTSQVDDKTGSSSLEPNRTLITQEVETSDDEAVIIDAKGARITGDEKNSPSNMKDADSDDGLSLGRPCGVCGRQTIALYRKKQTMVCRSCYV